MEDNLKILIIEDDKYIRNFISLSLKTSGYVFETAKTGLDGISLFYSNHPDIILLDLGLPDIDGIDIIKSIRMISDVPILVVSARGQETEKIAALDEGADDYITKPFHMGELMARIRVIQRKLKKAIQFENIEKFHMDYLVIDYEKRMVLVDQNEVHLTPIEYKILLLLVANKGKVLTHNYILKEVWGYGETGDPKSIRVFVANLRRKIEKDRAVPRFILTEVGVGYRFANE
ncbi:response regulator [Serpentinicella alkaliphila]|uniref:Stage 0 sporulation protein A homolog n=1 Tax=Serpentinicella alkaliphila TaxID=1734049 RepID=A0A4R2T9B7_9FIRM|nr:response regulator transcription factor [Serpentinicella alkaliphila]QUH25821.1 response regulator transcription factor [Serpentinicella alkaliphila]TCP99839.1 winged helix family two component transcriptional regulator [Serpentinicella alkaliphila]